MEAYLKRFQPRRPRPGLKNSILKAVEAELSQTARERISLIDRIWSSRLSWATAAALSLLILIFNLYLDRTHQERLAKVGIPTLTAEEFREDNLAQDLIALLGMENEAAHWTWALWEIRLREPTPPLNLSRRYRIIFDEPDKLNGLL